jgi:hypothetical protein
VIVDDHHADWALLEISGQRDWGPLRISHVPGRALDRNT